MINTNSKSFVMEVWEYSILYDHFWQSIKNVAVFHELVTRNSKISPIEWLKYSTPIYLDANYLSISFPNPFYIECALINLQYYSIMKIFSTEEKTKLETRGYIIVNISDTINIRLWRTAAIAEEYYLSKTYPTLSNFISDKDDNKLKIMLRLCLGLLSSAYFCIQPNATLINASHDHAYSDYYSDTVILLEVILKFFDKHETAREHIDRADILPQLEELIYPKVDQSREINMEVNTQARTLHAQPIEVIDLCTPPRTNDDVIISPDNIIKTNSSSIFFKSDKELSISASISTFTDKDIDDNAKLLVDLLTYLATTDLPIGLKHLRNVAQRVLESLEQPLVCSHNFPPKFLRLGTLMPKLLHELLVAEEVIDRLLKSQNSTFNALNTLKIKETDRCPKLGETLKNLYKASRKCLSISHQITRQPLHLFHHHYVTSRFGFTSALELSVYLYMKSGHCVEEYCLPSDLETFLVNLLSYQTTANTEVSRQEPHPLKMKKVPEVARNTPFIEEKKKPELPADFLKQIKSELSMFVPSNMDVIIRHLPHILQCCAVTSKDGQLLSVSIPEYESESAASSSATSNATSNSTATSTTTCPIVATDPATLPTNTTKSVRMKRKRNTRYNLLKLVPNATISADISEEWISALQKYCEYTFTFDIQTNNRFSHISARTLPLPDMSLNESLAVYMTTWRGLIEYPNNPKQPTYVELYKQHLEDYNKSQIMEQQIKNPDHPIIPPMPPELPLMESKKFKEMYPQLTRRQRNKVWKKLKAEYDAVIVARNVALLENTQDVTSVEVDPAPVIISTVFRENIPPRPPPPPPPPPPSLIYPTSRSEPPQILPPSIQLPHQMMFQPQPPPVGNASYSMVSRMPTETQLNHHLAVTSANRLPPQPAGYPPYFGNSTNMMGPVSTVATSSTGNNLMGFHPSPSTSIGNPTPMLNTFGQPINTGMLGLGSLPRNPNDMFFPQHHSQDNRMLYGSIPRVWGGINNNNNNL